MQDFHQNPRDMAFVQAPWGFYDRARASGPLFRWADYGHPCAAGHAEVAALLRDRRFGREVPLALRPAVPPHLAAFHAVEAGSMLEREPPAHTRLRSLVTRAFVSSRIAGLGPEIAELSAELIAGFSGPAVNLLPAWCERIPVIIIARLLGVPEDMSVDLLAWSHAMVAMYQAGRTREIEDRAEAATRAFTGFLTDYIASRRRSPADDLITRLIAAEAEGERLSSAELVSTCILLLNAGHEATVHALGNGVKTILETGLSPATIFASPEATVATVEEILRHDPPLHLFTRLAQEDVEVFGHRFATGDTVALLLGAANRDPAFRTEPHRFAPARGTAAHVAFGGGLHFCIGAALARLEMQVALPDLFTRLPGLRLAAPPAYADRYHFRGLETLEVTV